MGPHKVDELARRAGSYAERPRRRRRAARRLAAARSAEAAAALARAAVSTPDRDVVAIAHLAFAALTEQTAIDAVCDVWRETRDLELGALIQDRGWLAARPASLRALTAVYVDRLDVLLSAGPDLARALVTVADHEPPWVRERAHAALSALRRQDAREVVCELAVDGGSPAALDAALAGGFVPAEPRRRAVLLFLAADVAGYTELDFDGSLLRSVHAVAPEHLRTRLAQHARESGRIEWVRAIRPRWADDPGSLSDREWEATIAVLVTAGRWEELWRLAPAAPPLWSARVLRELGRRRWLPSDPSEHDGYTELTVLAEACPSGVPAVFEPATYLSGPAFSSRGFAMTPDGSLVAQAGGDGACRGEVWVWRLPSGDRISRVDALRGPVGGVAFTPDGQFLAVGSGERLWGTLEIRHVPSGAVVGAPKNLSSAVTHLAVTPDGRLLVTGSEWGPGRLRMWHLPSGVPAGRVDVGMSGVRSLAVSPDGSLLASGHNDGTVQLRQLPSGRFVNALDGHGDGVCGLAISPDGSLLAAATFDYGIHLWRLPSGQHAGKLATEPGTTSVTVTPDGSTLMAAGIDGPVRLWRLPSGAGVGAGTFDRWQTGIHGLVVSRDGAMLVTVGHGVRVWHCRLASICRTPIRRMDPVEIAYLRESVDNVEARAWLDLVTALVLRHRRHDIEVTDTLPGTDPKAADIELDRDLPPAGR